MLVPRTEHTAIRPSWDCTACDQPWPCANAKVDLRFQYRNSVGLGLYMASCMHEAIDIYAASTEPLPADLYERFLGWVSTAGMRQDVANAIERLEAGDFH